MSWFFDQLGDEITKSLEEVSAAVNTVNRLDILDFDAMAQQQEEEEQEEEDDDDDDEYEEVIDHADEYEHHNHGGYEAHEQSNSVHEHQIEEYDYDNDEQHQSSHEVWESGEDTFDGAIDFFPENSGGHYDQDRRDETSAQESFTKDGEDDKMHPESNESMDISFSDSFFAADDTNRSFTPAAADQSRNTTADIDSSFQDEVWDQKYQKSKQLTDADGVATSAAAMNSTGGGRTGNKYGSVKRSIVADNIAATRAQKDSSLMDLVSQAKKAETLKQNKLITVIPPMSMSEDGADGDLGPVFTFELNNTPGENSSLTIGGANVLQFSNGNNTSNKQRNKPYNPMDGTIPSNATMKGPAKKQKKPKKVKQKKELDFWGVNSKTIIKETAPISAPTVVDNTDSESGRTNEGELTSERSGKATKISASFFDHAGIGGGYSSGEDEQQGEDVLGDPLDLVAALGLWTTETSASTTDNGDANHDGTSNSTTNIADSSSWRLPSMSSSSTAPSSSSGVNGHAAHNSTATSSFAAALDFQINFSSFFDDVEDEVDLENDPILKQVELNKARGPYAGRGSSGTMSAKAYEIFDTFMKFTGGDEVDIVDNIEGNTANGGDSSGLAMEAGLGGEHGKSHHSRLSYISSWLGTLSTPHPPVTWRGRILQLFVGFFSLLFSLCTLCGRAAFLCQHMPCVQSNSTNQLKSLQSAEGGDSNNNGGGAGGYFKAFDRLRKGALDRFRGRNGEDLSDGLSANDRLFTDDPEGDEWSEMTITQRIMFVTRGWTVSLFKKLTTNNGIMVLTGLLLLYSYVKFGRYGTDGSDR